MKEAVKRMRRGAEVSDDESAVGAIVPSRDTLTHWSGGQADFGR